MCPTKVNGFKTFVSKTIVVELFSKKRSIIIESPLEVPLSYSSTSFKLCMIVLASSKIMLIKFKTKFYVKVKDQDAKEQLQEGNEDYMSIKFKALP